jgi:hypothetical protein
VPSALHSDNAPSTSSFHHGKKEIVDVAISYQLSAISRAFGARLQSGWLIAES